MFKIYNTLTTKKNIFNKLNIIIYSCGITVYDDCHIGHARLFIFFDFFIRYLNHNKIKITFIRNITDIDDKIIHKALINNVNFKSISKKYIFRMYNDIKKLKLIEPTFEPKATNFINSIIKLINCLIKNKSAYKGKSGDIYYNILKNSYYGILSKNVLHFSKLGIKNIKLDNKKFNLDFTLWKNDKFFWISPWGYGRPGWHTECAAINLYYGEKIIDIHSGGKDLLFPHHENELTQITSVKNLDFFKIWLHVGNVKINSQKMSKSLNNHLFLSNFLKNRKEEYLRFFFLLTHYRNDIDYSNDSFINAVQSLNTLYIILLKIKINTKKVLLVKRFKKKFFEALDDDFNTPKAIAILFNLAQIIKQNNNYFSYKVQNLLFTLRYLGLKLGIFKHVPKKFLNNNKSNFNKNLIKKFIKKRNIARKMKNWKLADKIRNKLEKHGIYIIDTKESSFIKI